MAPKTTPHPDYHIRGGDLYIRVDKTIFRVHSYFFLRESKHWKEELVGPISPGDEPLKKGQDEKNAIVIDDDKPDDFAQFLWVFYNNTFGNYSRATRDEWRIVLHFAAKWGFNEVRELAVRHLESIDMELVSRIQLYQEYSVAERHLFPLYVKLAERKELIGLHEARVLRLETLVLVQQARERLRTHVSKEPPFHSPIRKDLKQKDISDIVASTFSLSLADVAPTSSS